MSEKHKGVGLDVGTAFIVGARAEGDGVNLRSIRNAYFSMQRNKMMENMLTKASKKGDDVENIHEGAGFLEFDDEIVVIGDKALAYASCTKNEMKRPMVKGVLAPDDNAEAIMSVIIKKVLGDPVYPNETCRFSVPAEPFDEDIDIVFHEGMLSAILADIGYNPVALNEGEAVCYSELSGEEDMLTGGAFSLGGGQSNGCLMFEGQPIINFSVARGGDWIDSSSYKHARMRSAAEMTQFKETNNVDIMKPKGREQSALALYYRHHIKYLVSSVQELLSRQDSIPHFTRPIKWVVSGGTSMVNGCVRLIEQEFRKADLPFELSQVLHANEAPMATAKGCLIAARLDEGDE